MREKAMLQGIMQVQEEYTAVIQQMKELSIHSEQKAAEAFAQIENRDGVIAQLQKALDDEKANRMASEDILRQNHKLELAKAEKRS